MERKMKDFVNKLQTLKFWIVAFSIVIFQTMKGNSWHRIRVGFDFGIDENGKQVRKNLVASRRVGGADVRWEPNLSELFKALEDGA